MKIIVSACLLGTNCKYNGGNNYNATLQEYLKEHEIIPVCPEVMGGLPIPRPSAEIVNGIVTNIEGKIVDSEFRNGAQIALNIAIEKQAELAILQSRSPSCGVKQIYDGTFTGQKISGQGIFTQLLSQNKIPIIDIEDIGKLIEDGSFCANTCFKGKLI